MFVMCVVCWVGTRGGDKKRATHEKEEEGGGRTNVCTPTAPPQKDEGSEERVKEGSVIPTFLQGGGGERGEREGVTEGSLTERPTCWKVAKGSFRCEIAAAHVGNGN
jgi:hypothetical protein